MRSRVRFFPHMAPYAYVVEYKKDGWFETWTQIGTYKTTEEAVAFAKTFQAQTLVWSSDTSDSKP